MTLHDNHEMMIEMVNTIYGISESPRDWSRRAAKEILSIVHQHTGTFACDEKDLGETNESLAYMICG